MTTLSVDTDIAVPMPDGVRLATDVVRPSGSSGHPVVVMRTAYDRTTAASTSLQVDALGLARAGYAVVLQDVRGRYGSGGEFEPFVDEQADGRAVIEWCAQQPWANGQVAMAGISYNAFCQVAPAVTKPEPLGAIVPGLGPADIRSSWLHLGGVLNAGFHLSWLLGPLLANDARVRDVEAALAAWDQPAMASRAGLDHEVLTDSPAARWIEQWTAGDGPFAGDGRIPDAGALTDLEAPALVVAGWYDVFCNGSLELATRAGERSALVVGPWDHAGLPLRRRSGDRDHGRSAELSLTLLQREWYDRHLRDEGAAPPKARVFVTGADRWATYDAWPPPSAPATRWLGPGTLTDTPSAGVASLEVEGDDPTPALGGRIYPWEPDLRPGPFDQRARRARADVLSFSSDPLDRGHRCVGRAEATLTVDASPGAIVVLTLVDIHPDGSAWNVGEGVALCGGPGPTTIDLGFVGHEWRPGHAIGLDVSGAAWPRFPLVPGVRRLDLEACSLTLPEEAG